MRFAIALVLLGSSAYADPFDHRTPASPAASTMPAPTEPTAPPFMTPVETATARGENKVRYELVDPGLKQRDHAKLFLAGGLTLWTVSLVANVYWKQKYDQAVTKDNGVYRDIGAANHYHDLSRWVGSGLFFAGGAALGTAAYLYFTAEKDLVRKPIVAPMIGGDQAGVSLTGAF